MKPISKLRPSPALIVAMAALVMAMSGAAIALPGKNSVQKNDIENGAVTTKKIADGAVGSKQIKGKSIKGNRLKDGAVKEKQIADATITGKKVADEGLSSKNIDDYAVVSSEAGNFVKLTATDGATEAAARADAPATELFAKGDLTISAKCFRDTATNSVIAEIYVKTAANGAIFDGDDIKEGGNATTDFLNTDTPEDQSRLDRVVAGATSAFLDEGEFTAIGPDGTHLLGQTTTAAKNGELAGGNGVYGAGNVCLFGGEISG